MKQQYTEESTSPSQDDDAADEPDWDPYVVWHKRIRTPRTAAGHVVPRHRPPGTGFAAAPRKRERDKRSRAGDGGTPVLDLRARLRRRLARNGIARGRADGMSEAPHLKTLLSREAIILLRAVFGGLVIVPVIIYWTARQSFGPYSDDSGLVVFLGHIYADLMGGELLAWFLILAPYLLVQTARWTLSSVRRARRRKVPQSESARGSRA